MKAPEYWLSECPMDYDVKGQAPDLDWIKEIQIDAWRAGMGSAKSVALEINDGHEWPVTRAIQKRIDEVKDLF